MGTENTLTKGKDVANIKYFIKYSEFEPYLVSSIIQEVVTSSSCVSRIIYNKTITYSVHSEKNLEYVGEITRNHYTGSCFLMDFKTKTKQQSYKRVLNSNPIS